MFRIIVAMVLESHHDIMIVHWDHPDIMIILHSLQVMVLIVWARASVF